ncbi:cytochrome P450 [Actinomadura rubrisoli]|uniref:Cytochrome P450 n=1 Tax=Actinomadura rubrisoli TaxID=2530368 RepID=A0A4R5CBQ1_9ACTN|nr:cytochrome P450 [Actinomadura rubrisoli]TDD96835.1 cytochrome P450 [Actinomadura rubrisoli]
MTTESFTSGVVPGGWPVLGHVWPLMSRPIAFLTSLPRYGDLVEMRLGTTHVYVPCHPELLRRTLTDDRLFDKGGKYYDRAREMAGNGVATCAHKDHRRQRRLLQPAFQRAQLARYAAVMEQEIADLTESWSSPQDIDAYPELYRLALRTVTRTLFSAQVDDATVDRIRCSFDVVFSGFFRQMFLPRAVLRLPLPGNLRHRRALRHLRETMRQVIADSRADNDENNVLAGLLAAHDAEGAQVSDAELYDQTVTVLAAGSETVASTLTWALYLLSENADAQAQLQAEADAALAKPVATWDDRTNLPYAQRVVNETIRLYPAGWLFTRVTTSDTELAGRTLKAGTTVVITPVPVHRNAGIFEHADRFAPDRWLPERMAGLPQSAFAGFGGGARKCIGDDYGIGECTLALASIAKQWDVRTLPGADVRPVPLAAFYRPRRLPLRLTRRERT